MVLARGDAELAAWPLLGSGRPDLAVVDHLARLQLAAGRLGCSIRLRDARVELSAFLDLLGFTGIVTPMTELGGEPIREPEAGEEVLGVEEVVEPGDPIA